MDRLRKTPTGYGRRARWSDGIEEDLCDMGEINRSNESIPMGRIQRDHHGGPDPGRDRDGVQYLGLMMAAGVPRTADTGILVVTEEKIDGGGRTGIKLETDGRRVHPAQLGVKRLDGPPRSPGSILGGHHDLCHAVNNGLGEGRGEVEVSSHTLGRSRRKDGGIGKKGLRGPGIVIGIEQGGIRGGIIKSSLEVIVKDRGLSLDQRDGRGHQ